jgi:hypothetical protein
VVRHGHLPEREVMTGIGPVGVRQPRVRDRGAADLEYSQLAGKPLMGPVVGRSLAVGDVFNDGNLDLLLSTSGGPVQLEIVTEGVPELA